MLTDEFAAFVLIMIIIIIAVIIIAVLLARQRDEDKGNFGDNCGKDVDCKQGQCLKGKCSLPKGSSCSETIQCEPGTSCVSGICAITGVPIGGNCDNTDICEPPLVCNLGTCKSKVGGPCANNSQCVSGMCDQSTGVCVSSLSGMSVLDLITPMNSGPILPVMDVSGDVNNMLTLQENGNIIKDTGPIATTVYSSIKLQLICWAKKAVFGTSNGKLYLVNTDLDRLFWNWHKHRQSPTKIVHICCTLDYNYLWVESMLPKGRKRGYLFKINSHGDIKLQENKIVTGTRVYGRNRKEYAVIDHGFCHIYRNNKKVETLPGVTGVGFDPDTGETMTSEHYFRIISAFGNMQVAIPT